MICIFLYIYVLYRISGRILKRFELPLFKPTGAIRLSGRKDEEGLVIFLELARTLPGKIKEIPPKGGNKYAWNDKILFHLDLLEVGSLAQVVGDTHPERGCSLFHEYKNLPKTLAIKSAEKNHLQVRAQYHHLVVALTLDPSDQYLLGRVLNHLIEESIWKGN